MTKNPHDEVPTQETYLILQLDVASQILAHCKDLLPGTAFDTLKMMSDLDKTRMMLRFTISDMKQKLSTHS